MDVLQAIAAHAAAAPDAVAHRWSGGTLTWGELWRASGSLGSALQEALGDDRAPVVVWAHKQSEALVCFLACVRSGRAYVPVDDSTAPGRLAAVVRASRAAVVLAVSPPPEAAVLNAAIVSLWDAERIADAAASGPAPDPGLAVTGAGTWYVIYTSGSTGEPKGVQISADNLGSFVAWGVDALVGPDPRPITFLNQAPWSFDLSVMDTYLSLACGGTLVSLDRAQIARPAALLDALHHSHIDVWVSTPSFASLCLSLRGFDAHLVDVGTFLFCGETLPPHVVRDLLERFPQARVINTYGPTEATVAVTAIDVDSDVLAHAPVLPVGRVKPGCSLSIRSQKGEVLPDGEVGEVWIHGDTVSAGYLGRPDLTATAFAPADVDGRPTATYRTGDSGHLIGDLLYFGGRLDDQIKLHGYRIELGDIEHHLNRHGHVTSSVVLAVRDASGAVSHLEAVLTLADPNLPRTLVTTVALKRELGDLLPAYMIPKVFTYVDELPLTPNGKVDRRLLRAAAG